MGELCEAANKEVGAENAVKIANYLCPGNYAVSGGTAGCEAVEKLAKEFGARMCVRLAVAGAFHTDYMKPAEDKLRYSSSDVKTVIGERLGRLPLVEQPDSHYHSTTSLRPPAHLARLSPHPIAAEPLPASRQLHASILATRPVSHSQAFLISPTRPNIHPFLFPRPRAKVTDTTEKF